MNQHFSTDDSVRYPCFDLRKYINIDAGIHKLQLWTHNYTLHWDAVIMYTVIPPYTATTVGVLL